MKNSGKLFVVSAPSGAGKSTLVNALYDQIGKAYNIERVVTYTTKQPRAGEKNGRDYHFLSKEAFEQKIESGYFIEWSTAYGHYYGSPVSILKELQKGKSFILVIDRDGARAITRTYKLAILIWIYTKDIEILLERLRVRNTETTIEISRRLMIAKQEVLQESSDPFYHYHILNESFENALSELKKIVVNKLKS